MNFVRVLNTGLTGLAWSALAILVMIVAALFLAAIWQGARILGPDERSQPLHASDDFQFEIAQAYRRGLSVPRDEQDAFRLFYAMARKGGGRSSLAVAEMYARGEGTKRDPIEALAWAAIAENRLIDSAGHTVPGPVCALRDELRAELSPPQIERAIQRARELHPSIMRRATERDPCAPRNMTPDDRKGLQ